MSGPIVLLDTNVFLAATRPSQEGYGVCQQILEHVESKRVSVVVSVVTLAEIWVGFVKAGLEGSGRDFVARLKGMENVRIAPVDEETAWAAAGVRSREGLSMPDALIMAAAIRERAEIVVTSDSEMLGAKTGPVVLSPTSFLRSLKK